MPSFSGLAELLIPQTNTSNILFECVWSAVLSVFQTGTAISITVNGTTMCRLTLNWDQCASSSLLIPTAWLSSIIVFAHFMTLFMTAMFHVSAIPDIWSKTVYSVNWFSFEGCTKGKADPEAYPSDTCACYMKDIEATRPEEEETKAPWAKAIRRGIDQPFKRSNPTSAVSSPTTTATLLPIAPLRVQCHSIAGSRFIEKFRESSRLSRSEAPSHYAATHPEPFPRHIENHDLPIPLPRLSEWIRADAIKGIDVHSNPTSP